MSSKSDQPELDSATPNPLVKMLSCGSVLLSIFENEGQRNGVATLYYTVKASLASPSTDECAAEAWSW